MPRFAVLLRDSNLVAHIPYGTVVDALHQFAMLIIYHTNKLGALSPEVHCHQGPLTLLSSKKPPPFWVRSSLATPCLRPMAAPHHNVNSQERLRERPDSTRSWQHVTTRGGGTERAPRRRTAASAPEGRNVLPRASQGLAAAETPHARPRPRTEHNVRDASRRCTGGKGERNSRFRPARSQER